MLVCMCLVAGDVYRACFAGATIKTNEGEQEQWDKTWSAFSRTFPDPFMFSCQRLLEVIRHNTAGCGVIAVLHIPIFCSSVHPFDFYPSLRENWMHIWFYLLFNLYALIYNQCHFWKFKFKFLVLLIFILKEIMKLLTITYLIQFISEII